MAKVSDEIRNTLIVCVGSLIRAVYPNIQFLRELSSQNFPYITISIITPDSKIFRKSHEYMILMNERAESFINSKLESPIKISEILFPSILSRKRVVFRFVFEILD